MRKICLYLEIHGLVDRSGIGASTHNYATALERQGIEVTTDPKDDYDLLHLQWVGPKSLHYARQAHKTGRPVVLSVHSLPESIKGAFNCSRLVTPAYRKYLRGFIHSVDLLIAPSRLAAQHLSLLDGNSPIRVVSSGVDLERFRYSPQKRETFRRKYGLDRPTVLSVGQVLPLKGVETFLEVARRLPEVLFLWVGPRPNRLLFFNPRFERLILRRSRNVRFTGFIPQIDAAYSGCDLFFHPSHGESLGLVILEAAAVGLPIAVRRLPVYQGWLQEGVNCLMGNNPDEFAATIKTLLFDPSLRFKAGDLAREHALSRVGAALDAAYQEVL